MKVGDLVKETIEGTVGTIVEWSQNGWLVFFPDHNCIFWMEPALLEVVDESR